MIATSACIVLSGSALAFDFQATTPCAAEVVEAMAPFWSADWGNPSSRQHRLGLSASAAVNVARRQLSEAVGGEARNDWCSPAVPRKPTTWRCWAMPAPWGAAI